MVEIKFHPDKWLAECIKTPCFNYNENRGCTLNNLDRINNYFATAKLPTENTKLKAELTRLGFRHINNQETYSGIVSPKNYNMTLDLRFEYATDIGRHKAEVLQLAKMFSSDRFSVDPHLPGDWSFLIKKKWLLDYDGDKNYLFCTHRMNLCGFILFRDTTELIIDLIATAPNFRNSGIARKMIQKLSSYCNYEKNIKVGTQSNNLAASRLYRGAGLKMTSSKFVLHKFLTQG